MRLRRQLRKKNSVSPNRLPKQAQEKSKSKIEKFWHEGDQVVCTQVFRKSVNRCFFCGAEPIGRDFVLFNCTSEVTVDADFDCVIRLKEVMESSGSSEKIRFFKKNAEEMELVNHAHPGAAAIVGFIPSLPIIATLLETPADMDYMTVKSLMDFSSKIHTDWGEELFCLAMGIYAEQKYYIYESVKKYEEGDNIERIIEEEIQRDYEEMLAKDEDHYTDVYEGYSDGDNCMSDDDFAPEGLGSDEIDWDSYYP